MVTINEKAGSINKSPEHVENSSANTKKPHVHAELIKAWADGAVIECKTPATHADSCILATKNVGLMSQVVWKWNEIKNPSWDLTKSYRIKPTPKPDIISNAMIQFQVDWKRPVVVCNWNGKIPAGYAHNLNRKDLEHIQFTFDGETGKLKSVEMLNVS